jgi:hypothetical protein
MLLYAFRSIIHSYGNVNVTSLILHLDNLVNEYVTLVPMKKRMLKLR